MKTKPKTCPSCRTGVLETDGTCSCGYGVKRKRADAERSAEVSKDQSIMCRHDGCPARWAVNGYCREHWELQQGFPVRGNGNYLRMPTR